MIKKDGIKRGQDTSGDKKDSNKASLTPPRKRKAIFLTHPSSAIHSLEYISNQLINQFAKEENIDVIKTTPLMGERLPFESPHIISLLEDIEEVKPPLEIIAPYDIFYKPEYTLTIMTLAMLKMLEELLPLVLEEVIAPVLSAGNIGARPNDKPPLDAKNISKLLLSSAKFKIDTYFVKKEIINDKLKLVRVEEKSDHNWLLVQADVMLRKILGIDSLQ